jgi:acetyl-CoA C-acetyltransferase
MLGAQSIANGDSDLVVAGGQESMSLAPHVLQGSRDGFRMGDAKLVDSMIVDGLWDVYNQYHMGVTAENVAKEYAVTREEQDEFAVASQNKTESAQKAASSATRSFRSRSRRARARSSSSTTNIRATARRSMR